MRPRLFFTASSFVAHRVKMFTMDSPTPHFVSRRHDHAAQDLLHFVSSPSFGRHFAMRVRSGISKHQTSGSVFADYPCQPIREHLPTIKLNPEQDSAMIKTSR
jgi:hypothetical protein